MLGKLLKYEMKSTARIFLPLYPALILIAVLNRLMYMFFSNARFMDIPKALLGTLFGLLIAAIFIITIIVIIQRFYKSLITDEGYLMFTLPVKTNSLILSKLISAVVWSLSSFVVAFLSIFILASDFDLMFEFRQLGEVFPMFADRYGVGLGNFIFVGILLLFAALLYSITAVYAAISIGQLSGKNKFFVSVAAYIGITFFFQMIGSMIISVISINVFNGAIALSPMAVLGTMYAAVGGVLLAAGACYFIANYLLSKKLNLE